MAASVKHGNGWSFAMRLWSHRRAFPDLDIELSRLLYEVGRCAALRPWVTPCRYWTSSSCLCPSPGGGPIVLRSQPKKWPGRGHDVLYVRTVRIFCHSCAKARRNIIPVRYVTASPGWALPGLDCRFTAPAVLQYTLSLSDS